jgi:inhibitor of KinA sporulation pathway (predicted exonuclease)
MVYIAFDLELEQPNTNKDAPDSLLTEEKIIQLGYTIFNESGETLKDQLFNINIGVPLSSFIKQLTKITDEQISAGTTIDEAYQNLVNDSKTFGASRVLLQWGGGDDTSLRKEITSEWIFGRSALNVKHLFRVYAEANGMRHSGGLRKSMSKVGLHFKGKAHNALVDAKNTGIMYLWLLNKYKQPSL